MRLHQNINEAVLDDVAARVDALKKRGNLVSPLHGQIMYRLMREAHIKIKIKRTIILLFLSKFVCFSGISVLSV